MHVAHIVRRSPLHHVALICTTLGQSPSQIRINNLVSKDRKLFPKSSERDYVVKRGGCVHGNQTLIHGDCSNLFFSLSTYSVFVFSCCLFASFSIHTHAEISGRPLFTSAFPGD